MRYAPVFVCAGLTMLVLSLAITAARVFWHVFDQAVRLGKQAQ